MSKGNMLLGYARGKVGDIVFSRQDNEQIVRARNRRPKNPRTNAQLYQRAIMATVMQAYSVGKEIFDHSFQGKSVGNMNMREFLSRNSRALRQLISASVDNDFTDNGARVIAPKSLYMTPFDGMIISAGNYQQQLFAFNGSNEYSLPTVGNNWQNYVDLHQLRSGDIYTFIIVYGNTGKVVFTAVDGADKTGKQLATNFGFVRLMVKQGVESLTTAPASLTLADIFEVTDVVNAKTPSLTGTLDNAVITVTDLVPDGETDDIALASGLIRSRFDEDLRSDSTLTLSSKMFGIAPEYLLDAWKKGTNMLGNSDLILEGGNF